MALLFCDGMDAYATISDLPAKGWALASSHTTFASTAGKFGGGSFGLTANAVGLQYKQTSGFSYSAGYTLNVGFYVLQNQPPSAAIGGSGNGGLFGLDTFTAFTVNASGLLTYYPYGSSTANGTAGTHNICDGTFHWIEIQIVFSTTTSGSVKVYVDGASDISLTGLITVASGTPAGAVYLGSGSNNGTTTCTNQWDDFILWDSTGSDFNSFPIGPRRIGTLVPNGAGASTQFTPSAGSNWSDMAQGYSGTAYVQDSGTGNVDLYTTAGLAYSPASVVNAAVVNMYGLNPAGVGSNSLIAKLRSGGTPTTASGAAQALATAARNFQAPFYKDAAGVAWTATTINASQPGIGD